MGELTANKFGEFDAPPLGFYKQILARSQRLNAFREACEKVFRLRRHGLARNGLDHRKHVLGAVIDLAKKQLKSLLALAQHDCRELGFGYVVDNDNNIGDLAAIVPEGGKHSVVARQSGGIGPVQLVGNALPGERPSSLGEI